MLKVGQNFPLYINNVTGKGLGVFSNKKIIKGDVIEISPALMFNEKEAKDIDKTSLYNYYFSLHFLDDKNARKYNVKSAKDSGALALGTMSICNHSENPNAKIKKDLHEQGLIFSLISLDDIEINTEITISYGTVWFDAI